MIKETRSLMLRVIEKKGSKDVADGHCTFGVEYPAFARGEYDTTYFASIDLYGANFFTAKTMEGAIKRAQEYIRKQHNIK